MGYIRADEWAVQSSVIAPYMYILTILIAADAVRHIHTNIYVYLHVIHFL